MEKRGRGTILVPLRRRRRGNKGQHSPPWGDGECQSLNASSIQGIHIAHVLIDGAPDTLGKILGPEKYEELPRPRRTTV